MQLLKRVTLRECQVQEYPASDARSLYKSRHLETVPTVHGCSWGAAGPQQTGPTMGYTSYRGYTSARLTVFEVIAAAGGSPMQQSRVRSPP